VGVFEAKFIGFKSHEHKSTLPDDGPEGLPT
jgi:hypothetical protein